MVTPVRFNFDFTSTNVIRDLPPEAEESFRQKLVATINRIGYIAGKYSGDLKTLAGSVCDCCGSSNFNVYRKDVFRGFSASIGEVLKPLAGTSASKYNIERYDIKSKDFSYTIPESGETVFYTVAIQGCTDGTALSPSSDDDDSDEDGDNDF